MSHDHERRTPGKGAAEHHDAHAAVGRTTLAAQLPPAAHTPSHGPIDDNGPVPLDDPNALERVYGDHHHDPHSKRYEVHHAHAEKHHAKIDRYNRTPIKDRVTDHIAGRPGVVVGHHGLFMINKATATRYTFVRHGDSNVATAFDVIEQKKLTLINWRNNDPEKPKDGPNERLLVNPSTPRTLEIDGKRHVCVLTWCGERSSAWMKVSDLVNGHAIEQVARSRGHHDDPSATSADPEHLFHQTRHYVIRNDEVGQVTPGDQTDTVDNHGKHAQRDKVLGPGAKSGDNLSHYLDKERHKPGFDANGKPSGVVTRSFVSLVMNLPEGGTPPIALDTLLAGESFFAMKDAAFHRETPLFHNGKRTADELEKWVFGYVAMRDGKGQLRPDPHRRGWVPFRVLAVASDLVTAEVPQRPSMG